MTASPKERRCSMAVCRRHAVERRPTTSPPQATIFNSQQAGRQRRRARGLAFDDDRLYAESRRELPKGRAVSIYRPIELQKEGSVGYLPLC